MLFSFDAIESLPFFSKLPFNSKEKRILGVVILLSSVTTIFAVTTLLLFRATEPSPVSEAEQIKDTVEVPLYIYDDLEVEAILTKIELLIYQDSFFIAGAYLERLSENEYQTDRKKLITAKLLLAQDRLYEARQLIEPFIMEQPTNVLLAIDYIKTFSAHEIVESDWKTILPDLTGSARIMTSVAEILMPVEPEEAFVILRRSFEINGESSHTASLLGHFYSLPLSTENFETSRMYYEKAIVLGDSSSEIYSQYALTLQKQWELEDPSDETYTKAEFAYKMALERFPDNQNIMYNLAELYSEKSHNAILAEQFYLNALAENEYFWQASFKLGLLYLQNNKFTGALERLYQALSASPNNVRILHQIAVTHEKNSEPSEALLIYEKILAIEPTDPIASYKVQFL